jgi:hypothetical protein
MRKATKRQREEATERRSDAATKGRKQLATRSPQPSAADRLHAVFRLVLSGRTEHEIVQEVQRQFPGADPKPLILEAMRAFDRAGCFDRRIVAGWCFEACRDLYRRAVEMNDLATALRAVKQISDLAEHSDDVQPAESDEATKGGGDEGKRRSQGGKAGADRRAAVRTAKKVRTQAGRGGGGNRNAAPGPQPGTPGSLPPGPAPVPG